MQFSFYLPCYWPDTGVHAHVMYTEMLEQAVRAEVTELCRRFPVYETAGRR